uniref:Ribosomal protein S11 n=1 Tax=Glaucocystis nostochinearum TaxID=38271 RepID=E9P6C7_9EUKA|nr:ribosomal protein S11 [Glaucocystis nostochinearum]ADW83111.1 ribosomal protein S11 [Glaucocystis nostochinearum]
MDYKDIKFIDAKLYIKITSSNTILTLTNMNGNVFVTISAGSVGAKKTKRSLEYFAQLTIDKILKKLNQLNITRLILFLNGVGKNKFVCIKRLKEANIQIFKIIDTTQIPHGGCRKKKLRRL